MTEGDLLKVRSFGKTSLREVKRKLQEIGLSLGMTLDGNARAPAEHAEAATMGIIGSLATRATEATK